MGAETKKDEELDEGIEKGTGTETGSEESTEGKVKSEEKTWTEKKTEKTFTQEQVTKMMTKEKNQGRAAVLKELGIDPNDTKALAMVKALFDSQKTEEQKTAEKSSEEQAKIQEANQRALVAEAKAEAMLLGVKTQYVDDIVALALSKLTDDSDLKTILGEFKTKYSLWFGKEAEEDDKKKTGQKGTGSSVKSSEKQKGSEEKGLGARLAAQRRTGTKKTSYWS